MLLLLDVQRAADTLPLADMLLQLDVQPVVVDTLEAAAITANPTCSHEPTSGEA